MTRCNSSWMLHLSALALAMAVGCSNENEHLPPADSLPAWCQLSGYPNAPSGPYQLVSTRCAEAEGATLFSSLDAGLSAAKAAGGGTVLIDEGDFVAGQIVDFSVGIVGRGPDVTLLVPPAGEPGLRVNGPVKVTLAQIALTNATKAGLGISEAKVTLQNVEVKNTAATNETDGHGIQAIDGAELHLEAGCRVAANEGIGVLVFESVSVVDGTFIEDNGRGGVAVVDGTFAPRRRAAGVREVVDGTFQLALQASILTGNARFGLAVYGGTATVENCTIEDTSALPTWTGGGDGILVVPTQVGGEVAVGQGTVVRTSARAGLLASGNTIAVVDGTFMGNGRSGVWLQGDQVTASLGASAVLSNNWFFGAAATEGASLQVQGARIEDTQAAVWAPAGTGAEAQAEIGDGLAVSKGAALTVQGATLLGNARAGILANAPSGSTFVVDGTFIQGGQYALVIDNAPGDKSWELPKMAEGAQPPPAGAGVAWSQSSVAPLGQDVGLPLPTNLCLGNAPAGEGACIPGL